MVSWSLSWKTWLPARYREAVGIGLTGRVSSFETEKERFSLIHSDHSKYSGEWKVGHGPPNSQTKEKHKHKVAREPMWEDEKSRSSLAV